MPFSSAQAAALHALLDTLIPEDGHPSATQNDVHIFVERILQTDQTHNRASVVVGLDALVAAGFAGRAAAQRVTMLEQFERNGHKQFVNLMAQLAAEGYYADAGNGGNPQHASWAMVGFRPEPKRPFTRPDIAVTPHTAADLEPEYDTIVVGAGAGGGVAACVLAEAGQSVLLLERGDGLTYSDVERDHLRNHRLERYGNNTGPPPNGHPRVVVRQNGKTDIVRSHEGGYGNNAMTLGGGTRVYGAQAWRFLPEDFRMASVYGVPDGSSLADWPVSYDDLAPWYDRAEYELGVSGDADEHARKGPRRRNYPMPPIDRDDQYARLKSAADRLGWSAGPAPLLINSTEYNGRPPCARCGLCVGFACPSESKNGSHNTTIPRALATGRCHLFTSAHAERLLAEGGRVVGVRFFHGSDDGSTATHDVRSKRVVLAAGAVETARLLLNSRSDREPDGIGNNSNHVGRHLQAHTYNGAHGIFGDVVQHCFGPGVTVATCDHCHGNDGMIGGGILANEFTKMPIHFWNGSLPPGLRRWGREAKQFMAQNYTRSMHVYGPIQDIPNPASRVTLDPKVTDRFGMPVARLSGGIHPASIPVSNHMRRLAEHWLREAGAKNVWSIPKRTAGGPCAGQHQAGTARMGHDPETSVTDTTGRVHGHDNVFICDGSVHVTNGGFNPVLTILALAYRTASHALQTA